MNFNELTEILKIVFPDESFFEIEMTKEDLKSWDSIAHLNLIVEIEDQLGITFQIDEIEKMNSFSSILALINIKVNGQSK
jgi:acyl carrier protein